MKYRQILLSSYESFNQIFKCKQNDEKEIIIPLPFFITVRPSELNNLTKCILCAIRFCRHSMFSNNFILCMILMFVFFTKVKVNICPDVDCRFCILYMFVCKITKQKGIERRTIYTCTPFHFFYERVLVYKKQCDMLYVVCLSLCNDNIY